MNSVDADDFKAGAVRLVLDQGQTVAAALIDRLMHHGEVFYLKVSVRQTPSLFIRHWGLDRRIGATPR